MVVSDTDILDLPRGVLSESDREFLLKSPEEREEDYTRQGRSKRRKAIRERTRAAFYDFALLYETLDEDERNKIFDPPPEETPDLSRAMIDMIAFLYHALEGDVGSNAAQYRSFHYPFGQLLEAGVNLGELSRRPHTSEEPFSGIVNVDFSVVVHESQKVDTDRVVEQLAENAGRGLTDEELRTTILHAARETASTNDSVATVDGEPVEEYLDIPGPGLRGLAEQVEQKVKELDENDDDTDDQD